MKLFCCASPCRSEGCGSGPDRAGQPFGDPGDAGGQIRGEVTRVGRRAQQRDEAALAVEIGPGRSGPVVLGQRAEEVGLAEPELGVPDLVDGGQEMADGSPVAGLAGGGQALGQRFKEQQRTAGQVDEAAGDELGGRDARTLTKEVQPS